MDAILYVLMFTCVGVWVLVFTIKTSIKAAVAKAIHEQSSLAQESTLYDVLREIENLAIKRIEKPADGPN